MKTRILAAIPIAAILIAAIIIQGYFLFGLVVLLSFIAQKEMLSAVSAKGDKAISIVPYILCAVIPATMEYLKRGGRVGKLAASVLDILKIKPIFHFKNNILSVPKKSLGLAKAFIDAISLIPAKIKQLAVCYIYEELNLPKLIEKVKAKFPKLNIRKIPVSPMFGVHVGIGAVGIATLAEY